MKTIYYVDCSNNTFLASLLVSLMNEKVSSFCFTRKQGVEYLKEAFHYLKTRYADKLQDLKKYCKENDYDEVITIDLYQGKVGNGFDYQKDNFFEASSDNYHIIDSRYLLGRY